MSLNNTGIEMNPIDLSKYPNTCPKCGQAAYLGFSKVECSNYNCVYYKKLEGKSSDSKSPPSKSKTTKDVFGGEYDRDVYYDDCQYPDDIIMTKTITTNTANANDVGWFKMDPSSLVATPVEENHNRIKELEKKVAALQKTLSSLMVNHIKELELAEILYGIDYAKKPDKSVLAVYAKEDGVLTLVKMQEALDYLGEYRK